MLIASPNYDFVFMSDEELHRQLELEEMSQSEYDSAFGNLERKIEKKDKQIEKQEKQLGEQGKQLQQQKQELDQKDQYIKELLEQIKTLQ